MRAAYTKTPNKIADFVGENFANKTLLDHVAKYIYPRNILYYVFWIYSILTLWWLVRWDLANPEIGLFGTLKILISPDGLLDKLVMLIWEHPSLIVFGVTIFGGTIYVRKRMEGIFSKFWSARRTNLTTLLK